MKKDDDRNIGKSAGARPTNGVIVVETQRRVYPRIEIVEATVIEV